MEEERMLYIAFCVNVAWQTLGKLDNGLAQQHQTAGKNLDMKNGIAAHVKETSHMIKWGEAKYIDQHNYYANRKMNEAIYINAYAPSEGNFGNLMNNGLGSYIYPIWKSFSSIVRIL